MTKKSVDQSRADAFGERMLHMVNDAAIALMVSLGHRSGLFDEMAQLPPSTCGEISAAANLNERYVREWLGAMTSSRIVEFDPATQKYQLPGEHAASLTRAAGAGNMAVTCQWISVLGAVEDEVLQAFTHGQGVPYSSYRRFHEVMAEESAQTVVAGLRDHVLPLVPDLAERLSRGLLVLDVGCGAGRAMIHLAEQFPQSQFFGYDFSNESICMANSRATELSLTNAEFRRVDVAQIEERNYFDLITAFDAIHDQAKPAEVLRHIYDALKPGGTFLMQDIKASSHVHENIGEPVAPFVYSISCMHCMSVSLAHGGPGLGAAWGKQKAVEMLNEAGFQQIEVRELTHDILNYWYLAHK